jgi:hypothetical protein
MNNRHRRTLRDIFTDPVRANIDWRDVESLFSALGAEISEHRGSRVCVVLNDETAVFHRPHPGNEIGKSMVRSLRQYLTNAGVRPDD